MLEPYAGFWSLVLISSEILLILGLLYRHTGLALFRRWLLRLSFLLPLFLYWAHGTFAASLDPGSVRGFQTYLAWLSRLWVRDTELLATRALPWMTAALLLLWAGPSVLKRLPRRRNPKPTAA